MSKRTLGLGLGLLAALISTQALLTISNFRPVLLGAEFLALLAGWALLQWMLLSRPVSDPERSALQDWAESRGLSLLRCAHSTWHDRDARERQAATGHLYFVRVRDAEGDERSAWVRLQLREARLEVVRFRWEDAG